MGFTRIFIINRTIVKAEAIAERFKSLIEVIPVSNGVQATEIDACFSCVPGDQELPEDVISTIQSAFKHSTAVLLEAAYKPALTPVMKLAKEFGWRTIPGRQMLVMQGVEQFRLWTGFSPLYTAENSVD